MLSLQNWHCELHWLVKHRTIWYPLTQRIDLIVAFIDNCHLCEETTLECGETNLTHTSGKSVDLTQGSIKEGETRVFSDNCNIVTTQDGINFAV